MYCTSPKTISEYKIPPALFTVPTDAYMLASFDTESEVSQWEITIPEENSTTQASLKWVENMIEGGMIQLNYTFPTGARYIQLGFPISFAVQSTWFSENDNSVVSVGFFLNMKKEQRVYFWCKDEQDLIHWKYLENELDGWNHFQITLNDYQGVLNEAHGTPFTGTPQEVGLILQNSFPKTGILQWDSLYLTRQIKPESQNIITKYSLQPFVTEQAWRYQERDSDPENVSWDGTQLTYTFNKNTLSYELDGTYNLLGNPQRLFLTFSGKIPPQLKIFIRSHFQTFSKEVILLPNDSEIETNQNWETSGYLFEEGTLTIRLDDMKSWNYGGGDNDGIVRFPLQLNRLVFSTPNTDQILSGTVTLNGMQVETLVGAKSSADLVTTHSMTSSSVDYTCTIRNLLQKPMSGILTWVIRDYNGATLKQGEKEFTLTSGELHTIETHHSFPDNQYFQECSFTWFYHSPALLTMDAEDPHTWYSTDTVTTSAVRSFSTNLPPSIQPDSKMGVGLYLYRYYNQEDGLENMEKAATFAQAAGVKWSREELIGEELNLKKGYTTGIITIRLFKQRGIMESSFMD